MSVEVEVPNERTSPHSTSPPPHPPNHLPYAQAVELSHTCQLYVLPSSADVLTEDRNKKKHTHTLSLSFTGTYTYTCRYAEAYSDAHGCVNTFTHVPQLLTHALTHSPPYIYASRACMHACMHASCIATQRCAQRDFSAGGGAQTRN
eukprot:GHVU01031835.1.p1 GENE.GHVU01031835.1~~GHVU01031835.1.p1  ORF type:complete len:147 (-),score=9.98 GHVU01031835.1:882-1322(-)